VLAVFPGSPAFFGGLLSHDSILALDGIPVTTEGVAHPERLRGPACSEVVVSVQSPGQNTREIRLVRTSVGGPIPIESQLVATEDGKRIGYIFLPTFYDKQIPAQVEQALREFGELDGLILDNRMNGGGSSLVLEPVLALFASGEVGSYIDRDGQRPLEISPHAINNSQTVALAVLIGPETVSYGEIFAGILRDIGRAVLVGEPTAGNVETLHGYTFEDGSRIWIAQERFDPAVSHANWEAEGLIPDVQVQAAWEDFSFEQDPTVAAALDALP
jgi:carboxyl-terminal processing protease